MSDDENPNKKARAPKGKSDGAYKLKLGAVGPTKENKKEKKRNNHVGRENSPYINEGKRDTLAQGA
eukprot:510471-Pelagomonas_calceolata.AAC.1